MAKSKSRFASVDGRAAFTCLRASRGRIVFARVCLPILWRDRPVAFFPFQFKSIVHKSLRIGQRLAGELSDYFGIVAEKGFYIQPVDLLKLCGLKVLLFSHLDESQNGFGLVGEQPEIGHRIEFPDGGTAYWRDKRISDKKFVSDTERRERNLVRQHGPIRFSFQSDEPGKRLDDLIAAKRQQYSRTSVGDPLQNTQTQKFLRRLSTSSDELCRGVVSTLYAGETWVASHFGLVCGRTLHYWFPVYNHALRAFGPGRLLLKHILCSTEAQELTCIDRGAGDSVSKRDFSTSQHLYQRGLWRQPGVTSFAYHGALAARWRSSAIFGAARKKATSESQSDI